MSGSLGLVAGEASGDYLGAELLHSLHSRIGNLQAGGIGGPKMLEAGMQGHFPMEKLAVMGLLEPLRHLPEILLIRRLLRRHLLASPPDVFVGIDAPDFNLPLEKSLRARGIPVVHYVSPSVWAWRRGRLKTIAQAVDCMLCLLPFEVDIYHEAGIRALCVGHPLAWQVPLRRDLDLRRDVRVELAVSRKAPLIAVLPGSRAGEVHHNLPTMLRSMALVQERYPDAVFAIPPASAERRQQIRRYMGAAPPGVVAATRLVGSGAGRLLEAADIALIVMGTATLEAVLHRTPMVSMYRTGKLNWRLMRSLSHIDTFALPNLLTGSPIVPEILQSQATPKRLADALCDLLESDQKDLKTQFGRLHRAVRGAGPEAAVEIIAELAGWKI